MSDNRIKEGLLNALISAFSWGIFMNTGIANQATHCLIFREAIWPDRTIRDPNIVFVDPKSSNWCERFVQFEGG
jgi:hypothetical protein